MRVQARKKGISHLATFSLQRKKGYCIVQTVGERLGYSAAIRGTNPISNEGEAKRPNYCPYHRKKGHAFKQCVTFRGSSKNCFKTEKSYSRTKKLTVFTSDIPNHGNNQGKEQEMMMSTSEKSIIEDMPNGCLISTRWLNGSKTYLSQVFLWSDWFQAITRLAITKSIIVLTDASGSYSLVESRSRRNSRFEDNAIVFYDN